MRRFRRLLLLIMCMTVFPVIDADTALASGPVQNVRVLLRRLSLTDRADLRLSGQYLAICEGTEVGLQPNSRVTVQIRSGALYLYADGISVRGGNSVTFTRVASGASETGIRFTDGGNLYAGDLRLTIQDGILRPVLTISVEEYLKGVVPYEMSDSFPMEALKAQAVCARTYALSHISSKRDFDVDDTTSYQVFRGFSASNRRAAQAVKETAGVVGMYRGSLATCYYSASNGGQTELAENVWGTALGYSSMVDDPYDLENPESIVLRSRLRKDGAGIPAAFFSLLYSAALPRMQALGFDTDPENLRIDGISQISLGGKKYAKPSRYVTKITITFSWSGRRWVLPVTPNPGDGEEDILIFATPSPMPDTTDEAQSPARVLSAFSPSGEDITVTLDLFPDVVNALPLSISGSGNEMISLVEETNAWCLESRRYGHGVGMSQRGAQWMAGHYNKNFQEILAFYYPGMQLMVGGTDSVPLPTPPSALFATPGPAATPTPRPTLMPVTQTPPPGGWLASVEGIEDDSSLNLREAPNAAASILMRLYKHQRLVVLELCENEAWAHVRTDSTEGYVMVSFLEKLP